MSAICGIFNLSGSPVCHSSGVAMLDAFKQYHADDHRAWFKANLFLGCHAQYITPESENELLPYYDEQAELAITADAIIDNRQELFDRLAIPIGRRREMPDSLLILEAYKKWGIDCPKYLLGDFAFALWDGKRSELLCAVDAMGTRTLYYCHKAGVFAFSTLMKPLLNLAQVKQTYNETWIADFLATPWVLHQLDPELTLYEDIQFLPAGHMLTVGTKGVVKAVYWQITRQPILKLSDDAEYEAAFIEVFSEAVRCRLRSRSPVGVMMSGGLDSASVACVAAREVSPQGQRLQVFSSIPMKGFENYLPTHTIADESFFIEAVRQHAGNIDVTYCRSEGKHSLSDTDKLFAMLEHPYKIFENLFWVESILDEARKRNIRVMLDGQGGNATISWGDMHAYAVTLFKQGRWLHLLSEAKAYAKRNKRPLGKVFKSILRECMPSGFQRAAFLVSNYSEVNPLELAPISPSFAKHSNVDKRFRQFDFDPFFISNGDVFTNRVGMLDLATCSHCASITTKQSLAYRMALRDPTLDKRVLEFCLSLPENQYVRNGEERRFIRRAMRGIIPDKIRLNETVQGQQSADWLQRLIPYWQEVVAEVSRIGEQEIEWRYLDITRIKRSMAKMAKPSAPMAEDYTVHMLIRALIFSRFLKHAQ